MRCHGVLDRLNHIAGVQGVGQVSADNHAAVPVNNGSQVHMAVLHFDVCDVDRENREERHRLRSCSQ